MKNSTVFRVVVLCLVMTVFVPTSPVRADLPAPSPDLDGDGLSNDLETGGWYHLEGGPFVTDPYDFDSDDDGLSDGEEKLYATHPLDDTSPGIYVRYEDGYQTLQYFSTSDPKYLAAKPGGEKPLMTEAMVVRRGTTFYIGGPADANLVISGSGLTGLTPQKIACGGGWRVSVPADRTAGTYTARLSRPGWSASMPVHVIFELATDLSPEAIGAFLYDGDPSNLRDETSVWYYTPEESYDRPCGEYGRPCSPDQYGITKGLAQAFWTDQFKKYVFLEHAMPAIHGESSRSAAVTAVSHWADQEYRVDYSEGGYSSFSIAMDKYHDGTGWTMVGGACETNANVFTTMLRSAGIPARPYLVDWNKTPGHGEITTDVAYEYDHAVLVWLDGRWQGRRSFAGGEQDDVYYPWAHGIWGESQVYGYHGDRKGDLIISANEGWDFSSEGGMVNDQIDPRWEEKSAQYPGRWDYWWDSIRPLEIKRSPYVDVFSNERWNGDGWAPSEWYTDPTTAYYLPPGVPDPGDPLENWPYNPVPTACSPSWGGDCPYGGGPLGTQEVPPEGGQPVPAGSLALPHTEWRLVQLREVVGDRGVDQDGNGRWDELLLEVEVNVAQPGSYTFGGTLELGEHLVESDYVRLQLAEGAQRIQLSFDGHAIGQRRAAGPYRVAELWVTDLETFNRAELWERTLDRQRPEYRTSGYAADVFETGSLTEAYQHRGVDRDGDGRYEGLVVEVGLDVSPSRTYQVAGDLYDARGYFVGEASWTGSDATAVLEFEVAESRLPLTLEHLTLVEVGGRMLDTRHVDAYVITDLGGTIDQGTLSVGESQPPGEASGMQVTPTTFTTSVEDTNGNGRYDELVVRVGVSVSGAGGSYGIEGLLVDEFGTPVAWSVSAPQTLGLGSQELRLRFDGPMLHDHMPFTGTQAFKLVGVKIYTGALSAATLEDAVEVATTTPAYRRDEFDRTPPGQVAFEDDMENGSITENNWTESGTWTLDGPVWRSRSHAWASTSGGTLQTIAMDLSGYDEPVLRFSACYAKPSSVEVSAGGGGWTPVASYADTSASWVTQMVDLGAYGGASNVRIRFNVNPQGGYWYLDDVYVSTRGSQITYLPVIMRQR